MSDEAILVAVVDDEPAIRKALTRLLHSAKYRAESHASGPEFLKSLGTEIPACVVLDIRMQGMTGFDVQAWLKEQRIDLPIVFMTALDDPNDVPRVAQAGPLPLLRKPFGDQAFLAAIQAATGQ